MNGEYGANLTSKQALVKISKKKGEQGGWRWIDGYPRSAVKVEREQKTRK